MSKRNYDPKYIKCGFTSIERKAKILPQSGICLKTHCNAAMKPSLLKRHMERSIVIVIIVKFINIAFCRFLGLLLKWLDLDLSMLYSLTAQFDYNKLVVRAFNA